jgi:hypothetical protein
MLCLPHAGAPQLVIGQFVNDFDALKIGGRPVGWSE